MRPKSKATDQRAAAVTAVLAFCLSLVPALPARTQPAPAPDAATPYLALMWAHCPDDSRGLADLGVPEGYGLPTRGGRRAGVATLAEMEAARLRLLDAGHAGTPVELIETGIARRMTVWLDEPDASRPQADLRVADQSGSLFFRASIPAGSVRVATCTLLLPAPDEEARDALLRRFEVMPARGDAVLQVWTASVRLPSGEVSGEVTRSLSLRRDGDGAIAIDFVTSTAGRN